MIRAKNYEAVSKFVKVMTKILWPLFFPGHGVYTHSFNGIVWVSQLPLNSLSPVILIMSILMGQAKTLHNHRMVH